MIIVNHMGLLERIREWLGVPPSKAELVRREMVVVAGFGWPPKPHTVLPSIPLPKPLPPEYMRGR